MGGSVAILRYHHSSSYLLYLYVVSSTFITTHPAMRKLIISAMLLLFCSCIKAQTESFTETILATGLKNPWELTYGPDNKLWVTEARGYRLQRIDPVTGTKELLLDYSSIMPPGNPQGGMMGLAIHPDFLNGKPYFFLAYVYSYNYDLPNSGGTFFSTRVSRFTCNINASANPVTVTLQAGSEVIIKNELPGSNDHNSGKLAINLSDRKLYYTIGDMGAGQFNNTNRRNNAQDTNILEGKILRFNLEPDALQTGDAAWIPDDNPFLNGGAPTPVYSYGHRNAQGIVWADLGNGISKLYSSEHGDKTDDEINDIQKGKNYMWPQVSGFCDGNYNGLTLATKPVNETDDQITTPEKFCDGTARKKEPIATFFYRTRPEIQQLSSNSSTWPTIAPSSIDFYSNKNGIPGWYPSLLIPSLKRGVIYRIKLNDDGTIPVDVHGQPDTIAYFLKSPFNSSPDLNRRWRDVCISPDGLTIFACVDSVGFSANPGSIFKFVYTPNGTNICDTDSIAPVIVPKNVVVNAKGGNVSIIPSDVIQSLSDNCNIDSSTITISQTNFSCALGEGVIHQAYLAPTNQGTQNHTGELGMEFRVDAVAGIVVSRLGAFDHQGDGIKGDGIRVAIFSKATRQIVPGLEVTITGNADPYINNYRFKNVTPVTLVQGDYVIVAKGYNAAELNGNSYTGSPLTSGDLDGGAIKYIGTSLYGFSDATTGLSYPTNADGHPYRYLAGTFNYRRAVPPNGAFTMPVQIKVKDIWGNQATAVAAVTIICGACDTDNTPPVLVPKNITINANGGKASIQPFDVIQSLSDNCGIDSSTISISQSSFTCASMVGNSHQAYVATTNQGTQNHTGELGMEFRVNEVSGIVVSQLGAFDHQGDGIKGGGIRVAIFDKSTRQVVPGLSVTIIGSTDPYVNNYRFKNVTPVTLAPGDYVVVAKGYNAAELNGNSYTGSPLASGDLGGGTISYIGTSLYGFSDATTGLSYPPNPDGHPYRYLAGTFNYVKAGAGNTFAVPVKISVKDNRGNLATAVSTVTLVCSDCDVDKTPPIIVAKHLVLNPYGGIVSIAPFDVIQSVTDNCAIDSSTIAASPSHFTCAPFIDGNHQAYIATTNQGTQSHTGELGMEFRVSAASVPIVVRQLGAFDHQGDGIKGGGIRVAIFNKATQQIVPGLDVTITGTSDPIVNNYRIKSVTPVTLGPGDYVIVAKGYNAAELNGNSYTGSSLAPGDLNFGAISYIGTSRYGFSDASTGLNYPTNIDGHPYRYQAGTFIYSKLGVSVVTTLVTITAKDVRGNLASANAYVTMQCNQFNIASTSTVNRIAEADESNAISGNVYPNPTTGQFTLRLANMKSPKVTVQIFSETGVQVAQKTVNLTGRTASLTIPFDLSNKPAGLYFVKVLSGEGIQTQKIIITR